MDATEAARREAERIHQAAVAAGEGRHAGHCDRASQTRCRSQQKS